MTPLLEYFILNSKQNIILKFDQLCASMPFLGDFPSVYSNITLIGLTAGATVVKVSG